jgi:hypothetical protein
MLFAMAGWRLEHLNAVWVAGSVASVSLAHVLIRRAEWRLTLPYVMPHPAQMIGSVPP